MDYKKEIEMLKKENEDLKYDNNRWLEQSREIAQLMNKEKWGSVIGDSLISVDELIEENKKFDFHIKKAWQCYFSDVTKLELEIRELKLKMTN